jgi:2-dehydropantoate 2-reductase
MPSTASRPRFCVLGAGAIGAYLGAALARGGADVVLIARGAHLAAMREQGVRVLSPRGNFEARPEVTDDLAAVGEADCVIVTLKATSLPEVVPEVAPLLGESACVLPAQNGIPWWFFESFGGPLTGTVLEAVDPGGTITRSISIERVVGCVPYPATTIVEPGVIRHLEGTRFAVGEPSGEETERCRAISTAFEAGGLKCSIEERIRDQIWLKLVGNVAFNPVSALTRATLDELAGLPAMVVLLREVMREVETVGKALGIAIPVALERRLEAGLAVQGHKTSMLQDLEAGRPLELDCMTGAVIEVAARLGIPVPRTETVHACAVLLDRAHRAARPAPPG